MAFTIYGNDPNAHVKAWQQQVQRPPQQAQQPQQQQQQPQKAKPMPSSQSSTTSSSFIQVRNGRQYRVFTAPGGRVLSTRDIGPDPAIAQRAATQRGSTNTQSLIDAYQSSNTQAQEASQLQYDQLMQRMQQLQTDAEGSYTQAEGLLDSQGDTTRTAIQQRGIQQGARADQDLISRGLGNTTVRSAVQRGVSSDTGQQLGALDESLRGQKIGFLQNKANMQMQVGQLGLDSILSRANQGPDQSAYLNLISQLAGS